MFWFIFSFSFLVALTGAMAPGPLLTYTIIQSVRSDRRGYLMGLWVIAGHAALEAGIVILLLLGFSFVLKNLMVVRIIGSLGGILLVWFGIGIIRNVFCGKISSEFFTTPEKSSQASARTANRALDRPIVGGALVSMSNPYWWVWWATIGLAFMVQFEITFQSWPRLIAFFAGHEAGDLLWYLLVSTFSFFGIRKLNPKIYRGVLIGCGLFMVIFGVYLGVSTLVRSSI